MSSLDAAYFDRWHADVGAAQRRDEIVRTALGLPVAFPSNSVLTWDGIAEVVAELALSPGDVLLDLACGRGAYGLEIACRTGARLIGVDFSGVAAQKARRRASALGLEARAEFRIGDLTRTGLPDTSVAAVLCVDSIQFADPVRAGLQECRRVLLPSGRLVLTGWETLPGGEALELTRVNSTDGALAASRACPVGGRGRRRRGRRSSTGVSASGGPSSAAGLRPNPARAGDRWHAVVKAPGGIT